VNSEVLTPAHPSTTVRKACEQRDKVMALESEHAESRQPTVSATTANSAGAPPRSPAPGRQTAKTNKVGLSYPVELADLFASCHKSSPTVRKAGGSPDLAGKPRSCSERFTLPKGLKPFT
jgi:hypothetical protein